MTSFILFTNK